jgi:similar to stage IV sporulation protein
MNLCSNKGILLWNIAREEEGYCMNIRLSDFYRLREIARKTGVRVVILHRYGLPFLMPKAGKHRIFLAGLLLAAAFWILSAGFIWDIEINGNYTITEDMVNDFLDSENIRIGMLKSKLDITSLEKDMRREFDIITWVSAKTEGIRLKIDIKENDYASENNTMQGDSSEEEAQAKNLVSEYDGTVVSIITRKGIPCVSAGDTVQAGDLLISGAVPIYNDDATIRSYNYVTADGSVVIEHNLHLSETLPFIHTEKVYTGRETKKYYLKAGNSELRLSADRNPYLVYDSVLRTSTPEVFEKLKIPVYLSSLSIREYMNVEYEYSLSEASEILNTKLNTFITTLDEKGVQIIEKNVKIDTTDYSWILEGDFTVREEAGKSEVLDMEEINNNLGETMPDGE